jgi:hypothetical protein
VRVVSSSADNLQEKVVKTLGKVALVKAQFGVDLNGGCPLCGADDCEDLDPPHECYGVLHLQSNRFLCGHCAETLDPGIGLAWIAANAFMAKERYQSGRLAAERAARDKVFWDFVNANQEAWANEGQEACESPF